MEFLYQITAASRTPVGYRPQISILSVLNWICWTPSPRTKFLGMPLLCFMQLGRGRYFKTQLSLYCTYYADDDDMFRPLWAILRCRFATVGVAQWCTQHATRQPFTHRSVGNRKLPESCGADSTATKSEYITPIYTNPSPSTHTSSFHTNSHMWQERKQTPTASWHPEKNIYSHFTNPDRNGLLH